MIGIDKEIVPYDWGVKALCEIASVSAGGSAPQGEKYFKGKNPFVRVQHIDQNSDCINKYDLITDEAVKEYKLKQYKSGTIVFPKSGASIYLEKRAVLPVDAYIVSHLCAVESVTDEIDQEFLFYILKQMPLSKDKADGYPTLNLSEIKRVTIPTPPFKEQKKIVLVLSSIKKAIEQQEQIIAKTKELKRSLMNQLFTYGLRGEELKETEIGMMPTSWEAIQIGQAYEFTAKPRCLGLAKFKEIPFIAMELISDDQRFADKYEMRKKFSSGTYVQKGDLIIAKITPSFENGKQGIVANIPLDFCYATTEVWPLHGIDGKSNVEYLYYYLKKQDVRNEIAGKMEGSTGRQRVPKNVLFDKMIPLPSYDEQSEISNIFILLDEKSELASKKVICLRDLFKSLLQLLMSGQVRVKDIDFEGVNCE